MDLFCGSSAAGPKLTHLGREVNIGLSYFQEAMKIRDTTVPRSERRNFAVMRVDSARPIGPTATASSSGRAMRRRRSTQR
jgi:hypothetical protein